MVHVNIFNSIFSVLNFAFFAVQVASARFNVGKSTKGYLSYNYSCESKRNIFKFILIFPFLVKHYLAKIFKQEEGSIIISVITRTIYKHIMFFLIASCDTLRENLRSTVTRIYLGT